MLNLIPIDVFTVLFPLILIVGSIFLGLHYRNLLDAQQCQYFGRRLMIGGFAFAVLMSFGLFWRDGRFRIELLNPYRGQYGEVLSEFFGRDAFGVFMVIVGSLGFVLCGLLFSTKSHQSA